MPTKANPLSPRRILSSEMPGNWLGSLLTERQRLTCSMAWADGLSHRQIAAAQGVTVRAIEQRIRLARRLLKAAGIHPPRRQRCLRRSAMKFVSSIDAH